MKLSLSLSMKRMIEPSGGDSICASGIEKSSTRPTDTPPSTATPADRSALRNAVAAPSAGMRTSERLTLSAESGGDSWA